MAGLTSDGELDQILDALLQYAGLVLWVVIRPIRWGTAGFEPATPGL